MKMDLVLENIVKRRRSVPINDGRKIALVLFGGAMAGIRGEGALVALSEMGLRHVFDEVYVVSAGFPNVSYFLADEVQKGLSIYYQNLVGKKFINPWRFWKIVNIDYLMDIFKNKKVLDVRKVLNNQTKVYVELRNIKNKKLEYLEIHDFSEKGYFDLLEAAISIPYLNPGSVNINNNFYKDIGREDMNGFLHVQKAIDGGATDILVIYNRIEQRAANFENNQKIFEIFPDWQMSRFETRPEVLKGEARKMGKLVKSIFGDNSEIEIEYKK